MSVTREQLLEVGNTGEVVAEDGSVVGPVGQVYLDDATGEPTWVTARLQDSETFVPLRGARLDGSNVVVAYGRATIDDAPAVRSDGQISADEERNLLRHYHLSAATESAERSAGDRSAQEPSALGGHAMTRSEERLRVGVQAVAARRAVLRKYVVTEEVTLTVQRRREEVRLDVEPLAGGAGAGAASTPFGDDTVDLVLYEEQPVVQMRLVPVERVRLVKDVVTDQVVVRDEVRKEQIDVDHSSAGRPATR